MNDNRLIALFMDGACERYSRIHPSFQSQYQNSWDSLMPVIEAINDYRNMDGDLLYGVEIDEFSCMIKRGLHTAIIVDRSQAINLREMIYLAVVEFAKRFHENGLSL